MKRTKNILGFYRKMITECIPLFVAAGLITALCSESGLFGNSYLYEIPSILYQAVIPLLLGYKSGKACGGDAGGLAGALAASAVILKGPPLTIMTSILAGSMAGFLFYTGMRVWRKRIPAGFEMLVGNLCLAVTGLAVGLISYWILLPAELRAELFLAEAVKSLVSTGLLPWVGVIIEPMKVFFFNNWLNHGILFPLGLEQIKTSGSSVLFLLEENPGPGFGILAAYMLLRRSKKEEMPSDLIIQLFGGIHEVYFPYVLSDVRLLLAIIAGAVAGNYCFWFSGCGLKGPASPGSVLTILMLADHNQWPALAGGIVVSAAVSCGVSLVLLKHGRTSHCEEQKKPYQPEKAMRKDRERMNLYFVCDAGLGSSAMASALFRKKLKAEKIDNIQVFHVAADQIPEDADLLVCQKNFKSFMPETGHECFTVESLTDMDSYDELVSWLKGDVSDEQ